MNIYLYIIYLIKLCLIKTYNINKFYNLLLQIQLHSNLTSVTHKLWSFNCFTYKP